MTDELIDRMARLWISGGGDAEGISWCWKTIARRVMEIEEGELMEVQKKMTIIEVYEKYKHLDYLLSDKKNWLSDSFGGNRPTQGTILFDLWQAIRSSQMEKK